jgi:protocatechuate 3,4-dioxygenase beta subunit
MVRVLACLTAAAAVAGVLGVGGPGAQGACRPTAGDTPGPFERIDAPRRAKIGTGHVLRGRVVRAGDCAPVARALVVFWQAGPGGYVYRPRGRGSVLTDRLGRFRIEGPVPASAGFRPPHIHMAVIHPDYEELLTRYVVRRGAASGTMRIVVVPLL